MENANIGCIQEASIGFAAGDVGTVAEATLDFVLIPRRTGMGTYHIFKKVLVPIPMQTLATLQMTWELASD